MFAMAIPRTRSSATPSRAASRAASASASASPRRWPPRATVTCWDNSTRGLDASTAFNYAKSLRIMTDVCGRTTLITLYQAGEGIYDLMDKVLVMDEGRMLYQGPAHEAKQYFVDLGFHCPPRQTTADFLTSVCDLNARQFRPGFEARAPRRPRSWSGRSGRVPAYPWTSTTWAASRSTCATRARRRADVCRLGARRQVPDGPEAVRLHGRLWKQVRRARGASSGWSGVTRRRCTPSTSSSSATASLSRRSFTTSRPTRAAPFCAAASLLLILFLGWLQLSELMKAVSGRAVIARHGEYAFYRPSAVSLARVLADRPCSPWRSSRWRHHVLHDGVGRGGRQVLHLHAPRVRTTICLTALYRMFAAVSPTMDDAVRFSGIALNLLIVYTGYTLAKPVLLGQKIWFGWLYYVNPISYAFEAVLTNEFAGRTMECAPAQLVPQGPGIRPENQGCAIAGSHPGNPQVAGSDYLSSQFEYSRPHLWRNFGIVIAFTVGYIALTVLATEKMSFGGSGLGALVFKSSKTPRRAARANNKTDEEQHAQPGDVTAAAVARQ